MALVRRSTSGSRPTEEGAPVSGWARRVLEAAEAFDARAWALRGQRDSRLRVAASMTVAEYLLPGRLIALHERHPGTAVSPAAGNSVSVARHVHSGDADLGFVEGPDVPPGLDAAVIGRDRPLVVTAPSHPWARSRKALPAAAALVLREQGSGTRQVLDAAPAGHGGPAVALLELASATAVKAATVSGEGPAVLSGFAVAEELAAGRPTAVPVEGLDLSRALRAVWPAGHRPAGPARDLLALTRSA